MASPGLVAFAHHSKNDDRALGGLTRWTMM